MTMPLWLAPDPLLLASRSKTRRMLLAAAGIPVEVDAAELDERAVEASATSKETGAMAALLAREKAILVQQRHPERVVVGADQILALDERRFSKPIDRAAALVQLRALSGRTQELYSAVACVHKGTPVFEHVSVSRLTMRALSDRFLDQYLDAAGDVVTESVGGFQLEGVGSQLFERVDGDFFAILGLPLLELLGFLRRYGCLLS